MSKTGCIISHEGIEYLCGLIRDINGLDTNLIDDLNIKSNGTFSSVRINTLLNALKTDCNDYTFSLVSNLSRLELKIVTDEADIVDSNILYLHKPTGQTSYNQYVVIEGNKVLLGTTDINMSDYYTITQADNKFTLKTDFDALKTEVDKVKTTLGTKVDKTDIVDNLTSTDIDKPLSANQGKVLKDEVDLKANDDEVVKKTDITTKINSASTSTDIASAKSVYDFKNYTIINYPDLKAKNTITVFSDLVKLVPMNKTWYIVNFAEKSLNTADAIEKFGFPTNMNAWGNIQITCKQRFDAYRSYYIELQTDGNSQFTYRWLGECTSVESGDIEAYTIQWKMLCSTSVADVGVTDIKFTSTTNYKSSSKIPLKYNVSNGICYVTGGINCVSPSSSDTQVSTLPKPKSGYQYCKTMGVASNATDVNTPLLFVGTKGELFLSKGLANGDYRCTFSYPVA